MIKFDVHLIQDFSLSLTFRNSKIIVIGDSVLRTITSF